MHEYLNLTISISGFSHMRRDTSLLRCGKWPTIITSSLVSLSSFAIMYGSAVGSIFSFSMSPFAGWRNFDNISAVSFDLVFVLCIIVAILFFPMIFSAIFAIFTVSVLPFSVMCLSGSSDFGFASACCTMYILTIYKSPLF